MSVFVKAHRRGNSQVRSFTRTSGDRRVHTWNQINTAMMKTGNSPRRILNVMSNLRKVRGHSLGRVGFVRWGHLNQALMRSGHSTRSIVNVMSALPKRRRR